MPPPSFSGTLLGDTKPFKTSTLAAYRQGLSQTKRQRRIRAKVNLFFATIDQQETSLNRKQTYRPASALSKEFANGFAQM
jgi:hypothetical protein